MLQAIDVKQIIFGSHKLSKMRTLENHVERVKRVIIKAYLLKRNCRVEDTLVLYHEVKRLFAFAPLTRKRRRLEQMSWKAYYNLISKRKGVLVGFEEDENNN